VSERLPDAADSAEPAPRRASGEESAGQPRQSPPAAGSTSRPTSADGQARADGASPRSGRPDEQARQGPPADRQPRQSAAADEAARPGPADGQARKGQPTDRGPRQSPPAEGAPSRSVLADKARAVSAGARPGRTVADEAATPAAAKSTRGRGGRKGGPPAPRRTAADVARAAAEKSTPGEGDDTAAEAARTVERERPGGPWPMAERSLMATVLGVHPATAVGVAAAFTAVGVVIDLLRAGTLGTAFTICYLAGCVLATAWVRRSGLFWPMVAPPLLMAVAVPVVVLVAGTPRPGAGIAQRLLVIGAPLVNGFPMMAWTTGLVLALGLFRLVTQRVNPGRGAARAGGRTSTSPRRS